MPVPLGYSVEESTTNIARDSLTVRVPMGNRAQESHRNTSAPSREGRAFASATAMLRYMSPQEPHGQHRSFNVP